MNNNEFMIELIAKLQQAKSKKQINTDIRQLEKTINMLRLTGTLAKGNTKKEINQYVKELETKLSYVKLKAKLDGKNLKREIDNTLHNMTFNEMDALKIDGNKTKLKMQKVMADIKAYAEKTPISVNVSLKKEKLSDDLTSFLNKNSKIRESSVLLAESERIRELIDSVDDKRTLRNATDAFGLFKSEVTATGYAGKSAGQKMKDMMTHITKIGSLFGIASMAVNNFVKSLKNLKANDTILTKISKTSELTKRQLKNLGDEAFKTASRYGQLSGNFLLSVQEMADSGYEKLSKELAELSLLAQSAGDMTAENANNYLLATDAAYKYGGSVEKLNAALDGANYISNRNSAGLTDIADATRVSASFAANAGVAIDELTAAEATMIATTKRAGSEIGRAFRSIVLNLQQVSGEFDGEVIDEEQLKKVEARCRSLGVELEYVKDGVAVLRNPMEVLKDLAGVYNALPDNSADKQGLISDLGGKLHADALSGLLSQWDLYEKMLSEFSQGTGSALEEAEKTANSWEGRLNSLQNSFDSFVNSLTNKEMIISGISFFDRLIQGAEALTDTIGEIPVMLTAVNSAMVAANKDYGITQVWNKDKRKIDIQGNIFGIDFTAIKKMKKHFSEAEEFIAGWNTELVTGKADINDFGEAIVQNNAQFKAYLATCSQDAPASIEGYKSYLKAAGVNTDTLRLKTILLNSAITMLGGWAIQAVITGFYEFSQVSGKVAERAKELGDSFNDTKSEIEDYKAQIEESYKTINDSSSSIEDVANARKSLLSIQDDLIDKFGTEKSVIENVTDAINGQTDALDKFTNIKWQETKNEFNNGGFWNDVANFFQGTDNIERMMDEFGEQTISFSWVDYVDMNKLTDEMVAELENIGIDIRVSTDNLQAVRDFDSLTEAIEDTKGASLSLSGNAEEIYNKLLALQNLIGNDDSFDKLYDKVGSTAESYKELTEKYKNFYDQYILQEKILADDSKYADTFKNITDAAEKYNEAFVSGDEVKMKAAADEYASLVSTAMSTAIANGDADVAAYFENMYPTLKAIVNGWNFNIAFDTNENDLQGKVQSVLNGLKDENGRSLTVEEILGLGAENEQYQALISIAHDYNMTIEEMIALLKERNLVSAMDYQGLAGLFGQENIDKLTPEDLEIAYTIKNVGNMTFEELQAEIEKTKEMLVDEPISQSLSQTIDRLNTQLKPAFDSLKSAYQDIFIGDDVINLENVDISMLDSIKSKLDDLNAIDGINIDYSSFENLARVLTDTSSNTDDVKTAVNLLATDIVNGLNPALSDCSGENYRLVQSLLESTGITNAEAVMVSSLGYTYEDYAAAKKECADAGIDLTDKTEQEIEKLTWQQIATETCGQALALLQLKKALCNETALTPGSDINSLYQLAKAAGIATEKIAMLAGLNAAYEKESAAGHTQAALAIANRMEEVKADVEKQFSEIGNVEVDFSVKNNKGASSAAAKEAETDYKNLLDKEINYLEKQLDANIITFKEYTGKRRKIIEDYYHDGRIAAEDYYDALEDMYNDQLSLYDRAVNAVTDSIDDEIERLKEQKETIEDTYQVKINAIQSEIDTLNKANDARKARIDLEKAQYEAERARNQRVNKIFNGEQFIYEADMESVRDAENNLADKEFQLNIFRLEEQIESLKREMENATKSLDFQISALEAYKGKWNEISGVYEKQQNKLIAAEVLGADWESQVLNGRLDTLRSFTEQYIALQQAQADAAVNAARIKAEAVAGNTSGGKVGSIPDTGGKNGDDNDSSTSSSNSGKWYIINKATGEKLSRGFDSSREASKYLSSYAGTQSNHSVTLKKFHNGLDEGYVTVQGKSKPVNQSLELIKKLASDGVLPDEFPAILQHGELVLTPEQQQNMVNNARMAFFRSNGINLETDGYSAISHIQTSPQNVYNNNISISCPNVTNNTGAEYILKSLQRLPLDTLQFTHRRNK